MTYERHLAIGGTRGKSPLGKHSLSFLKWVDKNSFTAIVRETVIKTHANARKIIGNATANATPGTTGAVTTLDVMNSFN